MKNFAFAIFLIVCLQTNKVLGADDVECHFCAYWDEPRCQFMKLPDRFSLVDHNKNCIDADWEEADGGAVSGIAIEEAPKCFYIEIYSEVEDRDAHDVVCAMRGGWDEELNLDKWPTMEYDGESSYQDFSLVTKTCSQDFCNFSTTPGGALSVLIGTAAVAFLLARF